MATRTCVSCTCRALPRTMQALPTTTTSSAMCWPSSRSASRSRSSAASREERICVDPGIGFGKTPDQNLELLRRLDELRALGRPVLVGVSRKSTLGKVLGDAGRDQGGVAASLAAAVAAFDRGAAMIRAHDVGATVEALAVAAAVERGMIDGVRIELSGLVVFGRHGYLEEERRLGQRFLVDLWVDVRGEATDTDRIEDTVDYRRLAALVREVFAGPGAAAAGRRSRERSPTASSSAHAAVEHVRVRVRKPDVVLDPPVEYAAVVVERSRA